MIMIHQSCPMGLTGADIRELLGSREREFWKWMNGQTMSLCDGKRYNYAAKEYETTECWGRPHGVVVYSSDVRRFMAGLPVLD